MINIMLKSILILLFNLFFIDSCTIPDIPCDNEFVCPRLKEVTHCSDGGLLGFTTYELSLVVRHKEVENIYALFGDKNNEMYFPPAYHIQEPFGADIGGTSNKFQKFKDSKYDSWLTLGITDGDPSNMLSSIGIDFYNWKNNKPLVTNNGAIFLINPNEKINKQNYIIGQLTILNSQTDSVVINVQGRRNNKKIERWSQYNITYPLNPTLLNSNNINSVPFECNDWFDGCINCKMSYGIPILCEEHNFMKDNPLCLGKKTKCIAYNDVRCNDNYYYQPCNDDTYCKVGYKCVKKNGCIVSYNSCSGYKTKNCGPYEGECLYHSGH